MCETGVTNAVATVSCIKGAKVSGLANYSTHEQQQPERLVADGRVKCRRQSVPQKSHFYLLQATIED